MALKVETSVENGVVLLDLAGRLWILDLPLQKVIHALLAQQRHHFVLDLADVNYIDSSGLGQLIAIWVSSMKRGGYLTVVNPTKRVRRLFAITKLDTIFDIFEDRDEALAFTRNRTKGEAKHL